MAVSQRPLSAAAFTESATAAGWKNLPSWYMVSEQDNAIPPDAERFMAKRMEAVTESLNGSHAAFIGHLDIAAGLILKALSAGQRHVSLDPGRRRLRGRPDAYQRHPRGVTPGASCASRSRGSTRGYGR